MKTKTWVSYLAICLVVLPLTANAADKNDEVLLAEKPADSVVTGSEWTLIRQDAFRNIKTYAKHEDGRKIRSFKIDMIVDAPYETVAKVHFDIDNFKKWYWSTSESKLLKKVSDTDYYYYQVYRTPIKPDRDVIVHVKVEPYTPAKGYLSLNLEAVPEYMPTQRYYVRMLAHNMSIKMTPIDGNKKTRLEVSGYLDPGGASPEWVMGFYQRKSPYLTMLGLARMVLLPEYATDTPTPFKYKE